MSVDPLMLLSKKKEIVIEEFQDISLVLNVITRDIQEISKIESKILENFKETSTSIDNYKKMINSEGIGHSFSLNDFVSICEQMYNSGLLVKKVKLNNKNNERGRRVVENPEVIFLEKNDDEAIIVNPSNNIVFLLNKASFEIWKLCSEEIFEGEIIYYLENSFSFGSQIDIVSDVCETIDVLIKNNFLQEV